MAKFSGKIGYANTVDSIERPGIWSEVIIEKNHCGDIVKDFNRYQSGDNVNPKLNISNKISIVADSFALSNTHNMRYVELYNGRWDIISAEIVRPRVILSIGGVYNGPLPTTP